MSERMTGRWAQAVGFLGVTASLLFVAYELKQSRDIAVAEIYQQKTAMVMDLNTALIDSPALLDAYLKLATTPDTLEMRDIWLINGGLSALFSYFENNHFQYQLGMISEEQMDTIRAGIAGVFEDNFTRQYWISTSKTGSWRKSFTAEVDGILAGLGPVEAWSPSDQLDYLTRNRCIASGKCLAGTELQ